MSSLPPGFMVHVNATRPMSDQTRDALITLIEVAYAAAQRGLLPDETQHLNTPAMIDKTGPFAQSLFETVKQKVPRKLKKRLKRFGRALPQQLPLAREAGGRFNGRFA